MPGAAALSQLSPGDSVPITDWSTTFVNPTGVLELRDVTLYCTSKDLVFDTSADAFSEALGRAAIANNANQTIQLTGAQCGLTPNPTLMFELLLPGGPGNCLMQALTNVVASAGLLTLEPPWAWHLRREALPGQTVIEGVSPFTTIDFQGSREVFELQAPAYGENKGKRSMLLRDLTLANLPILEASQGMVELEFLASMLWLAVAGEGPTREAIPLYHLQNVHAVVSCAEVNFLGAFFARLHSNSVRHDSSYIDFEVRFNHTTCANGVHFEHMQPRSRPCCWCTLSIMLAPKVAAVLYASPGMDSIPDCVINHLPTVFSALLMCPGHVGSRCKIRPACERNVHAWDPRHKLHHFV